MKKENLILPLAGMFLILGAISCGVGPEKQSAGPPNILFIMSDDHGYQAISSYGEGLNHTPNIDRIADEGVRFTQSFVTNSICSPSRAVMLTGKFSHLNGQRNNGEVFDSSQVTFPKLLQEAGYQTAMIGKWHLGSDPTGFDYWNILHGQGHYYNPDFIEMGEKKRVDGYVTNLITDAGLSWLEKRDREKPFCLLLHHKAPHRCWMPDTSKLEMYNDVKFPLPDNFYDTYEGREAAAQQEMHMKDLCPVYDLKMLDKEEEIPGPHSVKRHYGIRTDRYKLIHFYEDIDQWELYDLQSDPAENHNLCGEEGYSEVTNRLFAELVELQSAYSDTTASTVRLNP